MPVGFASALRQQWHRDITPSFGTAAFAAGAVFAMIFVAFPNLDLSLADFFYVGENKFIGKLLEPVEWMRRAFSLTYVAVSVVAIAGLVITRIHAKQWLQLGFTKWLFLAICLVMGPGVVSNLAFKDHWGRARPNQIVEFGGSKSFTSALLPSDQCNRNCSFVSGEASSTFVLFFTAAYLFRRRSAALVVAGVAAGAVSGWLRMMAGAHFLSDIVFAGVFMALTVALVNFVFETIADASRSVEPPSLASAAT